MALDPYGPCPCGSGKKFKWCCQPIHVQIDKAFRMDADGQHDTAVRLMDEVTAQNPSNPEAWGRKAQLLYQNDKVDDAENALQKALEINPNYPFGYLLRGLFRQHEGEIAGSLLLFRKAADLYDPEAKDVLAQVYDLIGEAEMKLNRPLAARAALQISLRLRPNEELRQGLDAMFGEKSRLPAAARRDYALESPPPSAPAERRAAWDHALSGAATGKLTDAAQAFQQLTKENADDAAAWHNLGLTRTWLGDNRAALEAFDRYVSLENDVGRAATAWALGEVLRLGQGMEDHSDYVEHAVVFQIRDPQSFFNFLQEWQRERRLTGVQVRQEEGLISGIVLDRAGLVTTGGAPGGPAKLGAYLLVLGNILRLWNIDNNALDRARQEVQQRIGQSLSEAHTQRGPASFADVLADAMVFPIGAGSQEEGEKQVRENFQRYFEDTWIHRPLRALNNVPPVDAAGHSTLNKKLCGVIQFLQDCAAVAGDPYDFDRIRRKLGVTPGAAPAAQEPEGAAPTEITAMGAAELAALQPEKLTDDQLDLAYRTAQKLDARDLAKSFARQLVERPPSAGRTDRFPWYTYLVQTSLAEGNTDAALNYVNEGEKDDCEHNAGHRRNDYELRRGQVLTKRGEAESARDVFQRLIERSPTELRYRGTAAESMLTLKQGATALQFAEQGLAKAREKNDRDSEQYFMELVAAARKQLG
jgi:tetratricopeptide (TPR) repeat protein